MPNSPGGRDAIAVPAALEEAPLNLAVAAGPRLAVQPPHLVFFLIAIMSRTSKKSDPFELPIL